MNLIESERQLHELNYLNEFRRFWEDVNFESLNDLADILKYETVDCFWEVYGEMRACKRSPRPGEYAYFFIDQVSKNFALSLTIPFDTSGCLSHCARLTLETRTRELDSLEFCWGLSKIMLNDVRSDINVFFEGPAEEKMETAPSLCMVDHRFFYPSVGQSRSES